MIWDQNPELFKLGALSIRWYGLCFALGMFLGLKLTHYLKNKDSALTFSIDTLLNYVVVGTVIGARLGHCLFYEPDIYLSHPLKILAVWEGGLASHGALIGVVISLLLFSRNHKVSFLKLCDILAPSAALAGGMIRVGNFFNSEIIGNPTDLPWGITFTSFDNLSRHPTQLYEALFYFILCAGLFFYQRKRFAAGKTFGLYLIGTFTFRFFIEFLKIPQVQFEENMPVNMGQILSLPLIVLGLYLLLSKKWTKKDPL